MTDDIRTLWQKEEAPLATLPLDEIKRRAARFGDAIARRNRREYIAAIVVAVAFTLYAIVLPGPLLKLGSLLVIAGVAIVAWQLARRTSRPDPAAEAADVYSHYRSRLVCEEHLLARVGRWYLAPMLPGLLVFMAGQAVAAGAATLPGFMTFAALPLLLFLGIWLLNRRAAAKLREQIARLDQSGDLK